MSAALSPTAVVAGLYLSEYDEIVKPHQRFLIPNYFIRYWVSRLGPTQAWIVLSLQQACWRAGEDYCTISQTAIAEELGIRRRTVGRILREHPLRHWYIPEISYQRGVVYNTTYYPLPNKYQVYLSTPLIPEHMAGLHAYLQSACPQRTIPEIAAAAQQLLSLKTKDALAQLETYATKMEQNLDKPLPVFQIVEIALGIKIKASDKVGQTPLQPLLSRLHSHLTDLGSTACRQYFRLAWVPRLNSAQAWLVMILRSRCYYNQETGEIRDTYTWQKKDLAEQLGQSTRNLANLLATEEISHFIQILDEQKRTLSVRVAMAEEPLTDEAAEVYWARQIEIPNAKKCPTTPADNAKKCPMTVEETGKNVSSAQIESEKMSHDSEPNRKKCPPCLKDSKNQIPLESIQKQDELSWVNLWERVLEDIRLQVSPAIFLAWFSGTYLLAYEENTFTIAVKNEQAKAWLEHRLKLIISRVVGKQLGVSSEVIEIIFVVP